ncbi:MAG: Tol-Pal system beta propeller repeat protein TolB [Gammaproteobacteria bacterium]|nr:Tol-Pal system beta propeller repeat protein TolB [Gammaproteobacteria bacterium]
MQSRFKSVVTCLAGIVAACVMSPASAQLEITISSGVERPIPAAIVPFGWRGTGAAAPFDIAGLVAQDLGNSGYFAPIDRRDMVSQPTTAAQVNFQDWRIVDVDILLIGELVEQGPNRYQISFRLYDVIRGEQLLGFTDTVAGNELRSKSHEIADMVFEEMTGIPGVFNTRIAYISEQRRGPDDRLFRLIVADADGENAATIAESNQPLMSPSWSPDGRRIAYVSFEGNQSAIYIQTVRTGNRDRVSARAGINGAPVFSPDGRRLALTLSGQEGNLDIYTLDLTNQVLRRITENSAIDTEPVWSADGDYIFFTSDRAGSPQIYRVEAEPGNRAQRVSFEGTYNTRARVSPDGQWLAVVHRNQGRDRIALLNPETSIVNVLSRGQLDESPSFAPNGAMIIYATRDQGRGVLAAVSFDGRIHQRIASVAGDVREPVWSPYARP